MKKKIKITVSGCAGSGKSVLASIIHIALRDNGIAAFLNDDSVKECLKNKLMSKENLATINKNCDIEIETKQLSRKEYA